MRLYDFGGEYVFAVVQPPYVDAWGQHKIVGALFSLFDGRVQVGAMLTCNIPHETEMALVAQAAKGSCGLVLTGFMEI